MQSNSPVEDIITIDGDVYEPANGILKQLHVSVLATGAYEGHEAAVLPSLVRNGDRVLEFGAGIGFIARRLAKLTDPSGILCCEPNPAAAQTAKAGFERENLPIALRQTLVVGTEEEKVTAHLKVDDDNFLGSRATTDPSDADSAASVTLKSLLEEWQPDVLVVDIEGGEANLFQQSDLSQVRCILLELHPEVLGVEGCREVIMELRRRGYEVDPASISQQVVAFVRPEKGDDSLTKRQPAYVRSVVQALRSAASLYAGEQENAKHHLSESCEGAPQSPFLALQRALMMDSKSDETIEKLTFLSKKFEVSRPSTQHLAVSHLFRQDPLLAINVLKEGPMPHGGYEQILLSRAYAILGSLEVALEHAQNAVRAVPQFANAYEALASVHLQRRDGVAAADALATARRLNPDLPDLDRLTLALQALSAQNEHSSHHS